MRSKPLYSALEMTNLWGHIDLLLTSSRKHWTLLGMIFCDATGEFFSASTLLKQIKHIVIALVPKSSHTLIVGDYRLIPCCKVSYKVITKILASRLSSILGSIVNLAQTAFVEGKSMIKNIHLAQDLLRQYNRKHVSPRCLIKIDLKKAHDSVNWAFLRVVLKGLGFSMMFIEWVMKCGTTPL